MENKKISMESTDYFIKVLLASLIIGTVLGIIVSKIIEEQEEKRFITVTETGVKGITNENFTTTFKEFSVDFGLYILCYTSFLKLFICFRINCLYTYSFNHSKFSR